MPLLRRSQPPAQTIITASQRPLLLCCVDGCQREANPAHMAVTGMLGTGKIRVYLCDEHDAARREKLAEYAFKKGGSK